MKITMLKFIPLILILLVFNACKKDDQVCESYTELNDRQHLCDLSALNQYPQFLDTLAKYPQLRVNSIVNDEYMLKMNCDVFYGNSMLFDHEKMQPLYRLEVGKPGSSYAFELASKSGLPEHIINYAKNKVGGKQRRVDDLLLDLEKEQKQVHDLKDKLKEKEAKAEKLVQQYDQLKAGIEANKRELIKKAKQEALAVISEANSRVEAVIRELKEKQADIESQRKARTEIKEQLSDLKSFVEQEEKIEREEKAVSTKAVEGEIKVGSFVKMIDQDNVGEVLELNKNKAVLALGRLRTTVDLKKLILVETPSSAKPRLNEAAKGIDMNEKMKYFQPELNLIAKRGEEALKELRNYLDDAYLLGVKEVRIVHGKGYGILRKLVREHLQSNKLVASVKDEHIDFGGDGVSVVTLNH